MPFVKGHAKMGGRKRGTGNAATVAGKLAELKCDPIEIMAQIAMDSKESAQLRGRMASELAQYCFPKLRALEHSGPMGGPIDLNVFSAADELARRITGIAGRTNPNADSKQPE